MTHPPIYSGLSIPELMDFEERTAIILEGCSGISEDAARARAYECVMRARDVSKVRHPLGAGKNFGGQAPGV